MSDTVHYDELRPAEFRSRLSDVPIAYLPLGTLEWHGEHLPLGSDSLQADGFLSLLADRVGGIVLPNLFLGPDRRQVVDGEEFVGVDLYEHEDEDGPTQKDGSAYWVDDPLFEEIVERTLRNLERAGFRIVVAHGHGPSGKAFSELADEWSESMDLELFTCWKGDDPDLHDDENGFMVDHAATNETSIMMTLHPELVDMDELPDDPEREPIGLKGRDPREHASSERGQEIVERQLNRMESVLEAALERVD